MTTSAVRAAAAPPVRLRHPELGSWERELASPFHGLSPVFVALLALWSFGMLLARCCGLATVSVSLARWFDRSDNTTRQRLRAFYQEAQAKAGAKWGVKRRAFDVSGCFVPLLRWVLSFWSCRRLALALDVTNLGDRFHVLCVSVLYGGIGIPVAWKILPANQKESWHDAWCMLLRCLQPALGPDWTVVVLTDRGLESARLFQEVVALGWHPLMRAKAGGKFRPLGWVRWYSMGKLVPQVGGRFTAPGRAYKTADEPLACTLLACWDEGCTEPWLLLTDLPPGSGRAELVCVPGLDRARVQGDQKRGVAVATHPHDQGRARGASVVGDCGERVVVGGDWGRGGRGPAPGDAGEGAHACGVASPASASSLGRAGVGGLAGCLDKRPALANPQTAARTLA